MSKENLRKKVEQYGKYNSTNISSSLKDSTNQMINNSDASMNNTSSSKLVVGNTQPSYLTTNKIYDAVEKPSSPIKPQIRSRMSNQPEEGNFYSRLSNPQRQPGNNTAFQVLQSNPSDGNVTYSQADSQHLNLDSFNSVTSE